MSNEAYKVGDEITVAGTWANIVQIDEGGVWACDQDGGEFFAKFEAID